MYNYTSAKDQLQFWYFFNKAPEHSSAEDSRVAIFGLPLVC
jgi:hypothetical protein